MMFSKDLLKDKVILITGGGSGLGKAMSRRFLELGAKMAISGRRQAVLEKTAEELSANGGEVLPIPCDVRDVHQVDDMIETAFQHYGKIDVLVNNAAANFISPTEKLTPNAFRVIIDTVLMGTVNCTMLLGKKWIREKCRGVVLNIVTGYAENGSGFVVPSACAKAGVAVMIKSLASEWAKYGIRFVGIAPGQFPTDGAFSRILPDQFLLDNSLARIPMKRYGDPNELADLASYLISDGASYITGEIVHIDGGFGPFLQGEFNSMEALTGEQWDKFVKKARSRGA
jgi:NAD(P)-dependent dehydrogenase (short-subunit alcohol dehydrogenase family)